MIIYILYILFNHFDSEGTPNSKITGPYCTHHIKMQKSYHTKNLFYDEIITMSRSIFAPIFMKIGDKNIFGRKNSLQAFLGPPKKKIY